MKKLIALAFSVAVVGSAFALNCKRSVVSTAAGEMKIEITIGKDDISGFARLAETLPAGSVILYAKSEGGIFNFEGNKLKFIWMALPNEKEIKVSYVLGTTSVTEGSQSISGRFSYVVDGHPVNYDLPVTTFTLNGKKESIINNAVAENITKAEPFVSTAKPEAANTLKSEPVVVKAAVDSKNTKAGILVYRIQVASSKDKLTTDRFDKYRFTQPVKSNNVNGVIKYTTGEFKTLDEAVKYKQEVAKKGAADAFILPMLDGKVISITEAKIVEGASK